MAVPEIARRRYQARRRLADDLADEGARLWGKITPDDLDGWYREHGPRLVVALTGAQLAAAQGADDYLDETLVGQGIDPESAGEINPRAFAGVASDGRTLDGLLASPTAATKSAIARGVATVDALSTGKAVLDMTLRTQVADAGRAADGVALTAHRRVGGYVRLIQGATCPRCTILAGRWYRWSSGFLRHPRCDCTHVPAGREIGKQWVTDPDEAYRQGLVTGLTSAQRQALDEGADMAQLVNARRGGAVYTAGGRELTRSSASLRGVRGLRPTPEQIYRDALNRDEAVELLQRFGYLTTPRVPVGVGAVPSPRSAEFARWRTGRDVEVRRISPSRRAAIEENIAYREQSLRELASGTGPEYDKIRAEIRALLDEDLAALRASNLPDFNPDNPLEFYGDKLSFADESARTRQHLYDLETYVSAKQHRALRDHFADPDYPQAGFYFGDKDITELDHLARLKGQQPGGGWAAGSSYEQVAGVYAPGQRACVCGGGSHGAANLVLHEGGHALDDALQTTFGVRASAHPQFRNIYVELSDTVHLRPHYHPTLNRTGQGATEAWAEAFDAWALNRGRHSADVVADRIIAALSSEKEVDSSVFGPNNARRARAMGRRLADYFEDIERRL